ncbi:hypothetical protein F4821DRAFT_252239 [Hypoxylon rubiginosum]|uniref:Uncharacterized protein n=1 Tax=Hypoxylon rubiginosum TaxID=110542 RepID=A0ACC0CI80_9PEZI|nr:hypothetical protein F4821DRAFT_252239 [Hypoxylon rubiginosum]
MMEPSHLPTELFTSVVDYITEGRNDSKTLCHLSLVSRQWHDALSTRVYSRWVYDGEHHSISSLWKFLRSTLCNKRIADSVHELNIRNWTFGLVHEHGRLILLEDDLKLIRSAIHATGLQRIEPSVLEALQKADPRPLMALLLGSLRNVHTLYAQLPEKDIFLLEVLWKATESRRDRPPDNGAPLHNLREAHLASAWNFREDTHARDKYKMELNHMWPVFQLPNIQRLSIFDFEPRGASVIFGARSATSSITDLTLVHHCDSILKSMDTLALLSLPKTLTSLSLYMNDSYNDGFIDKPHQLSNADLWIGIRQHKDSIEHLDIYRDTTGFSPPNHSPNMSHFGSMQEFERLERLSIQPEVLLGGCCGDDVAPFQMRDTLPSSLKSLIFYGDEGLALNKTIGRQVRDVVTNTDFRRLRHVALEITFDYIGCYTNPADPPHVAVEQICQEMGVNYETIRALSCAKGGLGRRYYSYVKGKRLENVDKLETIRYALSQYLYKLRDPDYQGREDADPPQISLDDLDTYELPWDELTKKASYSDYSDDVDPIFTDEYWEGFDSDTEEHDSATDSQNLDSQTRLEDSARGAGEHDSDSDGVW